MSKNNQLGSPEVGTSIPAPQISRRDFIEKAGNVVLATILASTAAACSGVSTQYRSDRRLSSADSNETISPSRDWKVMRRISPEVLARINEGKPVAILVSATWCGPCHEAANWWKNQDMGPFERIQVEFKDEDDMKERNAQGLVQAGVRDKEIVMPVLILVHKKPGQKGKYPEEFIVHGSQQLKGSTIGTQNWLRQNGYLR